MHVDKSRIVIVNGVMNSVKNDVMVPADWVEVGSNSKQRGTEK